MTKPKRDPCKQLLQRKAALRPAFDRNKEYSCAWHSPINATMAAFLHSIPRCVVSADDFPALCTARMSDLCRQDNPAQDPGWQIPEGGIAEGKQSTSSSMLMQMRSPLLHIGFGDLHVLPLGNT